MKTIKTSTKLIAIAILSFCSTQMLQANETTARLATATEVFSDIMHTPDQSIPQDLLDHAYCIVIVPGLTKVAFVGGGKYGKGFAICRKSTKGGWGAPASVRIEGGSIGFQIGASSTDLVMLVMNKHGMDRLLTSEFTIGGDVAAAAGPVGRNTSARTGAQLSAEILSWSRSRGAFAGVSVGGATLREDQDDNEQLYGKRLSNREILMGQVKPPDSATKLINLLAKYSPQET
jgi:lipid-binding SYLF domain-containing protein